MPSSFFLFWGGGVVFPNSKREKINRESNWVWSKHRSTFERERPVQWMGLRVRAERRVATGWELSWLMILSVFDLTFFTHSRCNSRFLLSFSLWTFLFSLLTCPSFLFLFFFWVKIKCINHPEFGREIRDESESENE